MTEMKIFMYENLAISTKRTTFPAHKKIGKPQ